jgi:hypothetical protein
MDWAWWFTPIIPALGRLRQEGHEFEFSLGLQSEPYLKIKSWGYSGRALA